MAATATFPSAPQPANPLVGVAFPRTGKRGVPQQFPRRLFEMLDTETNKRSDDSKVISWSESGKAFRIYNVTEFATTVLPKYFRTKKFSSFQRNLNLYGFTKVRRGIDTDMYAHPSFLKDQPQALVQLRKIDNRRRSSSTRAPTAIQKVVMVQATTGTLTTTTPRSVSPPTPSTSPSFHSPSITIVGWQQQQQQHKTTPPSQVSPCHRRGSTGTDSVGSSDDRGKLDLLAFALEQEFAKQTA